MKKIKNFILGMSTILIVSMFSNGCSLQKDSKESVYFKGKKFIMEIQTFEKNINEENIIQKGKMEIETTPTPSSEGELYADNKPYVALTFDDGPSKYTEELVDLLNQYDIKCTFFVVGTSCEKFSDALSVLSNSGHEIAIHGETHTSFTKLSVDQVNEEITNTIHCIESFNVEASSLVRPPYGSLNDDIKQNIDYPFIMWNIDTEDWKTKDKELIKAEILDNIQSGSIILMHDTSIVHEIDMETLSELLPELVKQYHFVTVSELCEQHNTILESGKVYYKIKDKD